MRLGMSGMELAAHVNKFLSENHGEHDKILSETMNKNKDFGSQLTDTLMAYSKVVVTSAILSAVEENNKVITAQIADLLKQK